MKATLTTLLALAASSSVLLADITTGPPSTTAPQNPTRVMGNCDLLASNTVRATFMGVRDLQMQTFDQDVPHTVQVAVFQVIDNLAYRRYVRYGDGSLKPGTSFSVAMNRELPGQPASVVDTISQMQPGEEAVMKIDHLYIFGDTEGKPIRPCARLVRRQDAASLPSAPAAATPHPMQHQPVVSGMSRQFSVSVDGSGKVQSSEIIKQKSPDSDEVKTRMFLNGQEVDPTTRQPLNAIPAPIPAPQPEKSEDSDTIVEHVPQSSAPTPPPATTPADGASTQQEGSF